MTALRKAGMSLLALFFLSLAVDLSFGENGDAAPDFLLKEYLSQENRTFRDILSARANIMIVTETTCVSCIKEIKSLEWLRAKYRGDVSVTAVFIDRQGQSRVAKYVDYYEFDLDMFLIDAGGVVPQRFAASFVPTLIIFDSEGNERYRKTGFTEGEESLISARIDEVLSGPDPRRRSAAASTDDRTTATGSPPAARKTAGCASTG